MGIHILRWINIRCEFCNYWGLSFCMCWQQYWFRPPDFSVLMVCTLYFIRWPESSSCKNALFPTGIATFSDVAAMCCFNTHCIKHKRIAANLCGKQTLSSPNTKKCKVFFVQIVLFCLCSRQGRGMHNGETSDKVVHTSILQWHAQSHISLLPNYVCISLQGHF